MDTPGDEPPSLIGRKAVDAAGRRLGRVIAVIHGRDRTDVLIEGRGLVRRRSRRVAIEHVHVDARGRAVLSGGAPILEVIRPDPDEPQLGVGSG